MKAIDAAASMLTGEQVDAPVPVEETPLPVTTADAEANAQAMPASILDTPQATEVLSPDQPIQTAGLVDRLVTRMSRRAAEAEKRVLPALPDNPVQQVGDKILIRGLEQDEIDKLSKVLPDYKKGINFPRIAEEIGDINLSLYYERLKNANADLFETARRGTLNFEALRAKAEQKGADEHIIQWLQNGTKAGVLPEDLLGGVLAMTQLTRDVEKQNVFALGLAAGPERDAALTRAAQMMTMEGQVANNLSAYATEAGRALYVLSQAGKMGEVDMAGRAAELTSLFGAANATDLEHLAIKYLALPVGARKTFVQQGLLSKSMEVIAEVFINSILAAPQTHVANIAGNSIFMLSRIGETAVAGGIGAVRSRITGNADRVYARESIAQIQGILSGFTDAMVVAGKTFATGQNPDAVSKLEMPRHAITMGSGEVVQEFQRGNYMAGAVNTLGTAVRLPGRALLSEDQFFKGIGYRMHIHGEAEMRAARTYDQSVELGKTPQEALALAQIERDRIINSPPQNVIADAQAAAREMTFQKDLGDGFLGGAAQAVSHPVAKLFVPFFKTPTNIAKAVLERTPMQFINPGFYKTIGEGGRPADIALSKVALGSAIMGSMAYMAMGLDGSGDVRIHGAGPVERAAKDAWLRQGNQPYSISIKKEDGTYTNVTYSRFDPLSGVLAMAADFAYYAQHEQNSGVLEDLAMAATMSLSNYILEQPLLQGVNELAAIFRGNTSEDKAKALHKWLGEKPAGAIMSAVPGTSALGGAISRYNNPDRANTMLPEKGLFDEDPTQLPDFVKGFYIALQKAKAQNPYFNKDLPPALNEWGERIPASNGSAWEFINPTRIRDTKYSPVDEEIMKIGGGVSRTERKLNGVDLNATQFNRLIELSNSIDRKGRRPEDPGFRADQTMLPTLQSIIFDPAYRGLPTKDDKRDELSNIVSQFRRAARSLLLVEDPYLKAKIDAQP
jgi:hypothetical protein